MFSSTLPTIPLPLPQLMANHKQSKSKHKWFKTSLNMLGLTRSRSQSLSRSITSSSRGSREDELKLVFGLFDADGDGKISASELRAHFGALGEHLSLVEAQGVISHLDADGDGLIDFNDFLRLMRVDGKDRGMNDEEKEEEEDLRKAFEMFEQEKGSGCITPKGLQMMLRRLGDEKSYDDCVAMIQVYDIDGNGVLDFHEFHQMMV